MIKCITCEAETTNPKFCSQSCAASMNNKTSVKRELDIIICKTCGKNVDRANWKDRRVVCSPCRDYKKINRPSRVVKKFISKSCEMCKDMFTATYQKTRFCACCLEFKSKAKSNEIKKLTIGEYRNRLSVKGKHKSWTNVHIREFNRSWNKQLRELPCANCGYVKYVELAHIKAVTDFNDEATLGEVNHPDNIIQLCPNCHNEFDKGWLTLNDIKLKIDVPYKI